MTHDQDEALSLADRVAVLRGGRVAQCAGPEEIFLDPLDPALASFVGDANVLPGTVRGGMAVTALGPLAIADASTPCVSRRKCSCWCARSRSNYTRSTAPEVLPAGSSTATTTATTCS